MSWENIIFVSCLFWVPSLIYLIGMITKLIDVSPKTEIGLIPETS
jgi:hypothetical protein